MKQFASDLKTQLAILPTVCILMILSCTEDFNIKTDNSPPSVVIYGTLTNETDYQYVQVSMSSPYFDTVPNTGISGATVRVTSSNNEIFMFQEIDTIPGTYRTVNKIAGIQGEEYTLNVDIQLNGNVESYTAKSTMISPTPIDSIRLHNMRIVGRNLYALLLYAQDPPEENFYLHRIKLNDSLIYKKLSRVQIMSDLGINGSYINGLQVRGFSHISEKEKEKENPDNSNASERIYLSPDDTITFATGQIEKEYYNFISQCKQERNGENPFFGGPPSNIVTNLTNGAFGYFACCAFSEEKKAIAK
ncbi:MAG: DUF4249 domain-containing protein [Prevotellaceae bacterium]|jgi:hypothetical protein|nr:DUF4249 domain-containing protein [Prevotellaceae bacterium]